MSNKTNFTFDISTHMEAETDHSSYDIVVSSIVSNWSIFTMLAFIFVLGLKQFAKRSRSIWIADPMSTGQSTPNSEDIHQPPAFGENSNKVNSDHPAMPNIEMDVILN